MLRVPAVRPLRPSGPGGRDVDSEWPEGHARISRRAVWLTKAARIGVATPTLWGRYGFDGGKGSRDACRAISTRLVKPAETQCNCEHAARTRGLINRDVHPRQPAGGECTPFSRLAPSCVRREGARLYRTSGRHVRRASMTAANL